GLKAKRSRLARSRARTRSGQAVPLLLRPLPERLIEGSPIDTSPLDQREPGADIRLPEAEAVRRSLAYPERLQSTLIENRVALGIGEVQEHGRSWPLHPLAVHARR